MVNCIDVSEHQGKIDWTKVRAGGCTSAIIRAGWSWYEGGMDFDERFAENMAGATAAGLDIGVYLYSYDHSPAAARKAAQCLLQAIQPYRLTFPVYFDMEYEKFNLEAGKALNTDICLAFLGEIEAAGYYAALYCSTDFTQHQLDENRLKHHDKWVAQYASACSYKGDYGVWQYGVVGTQGVKGNDYTITGAVPGVRTNCDVNHVYKDYPAIIKAAGLNGWGKPENPTEPPQLPTDVAELQQMILDLEADKIALSGRVEALEEDKRKLALQMNKADTTLQDIVVWIKKYFDKERL